ncbi:MAG: hypothetical protein QW587_07990 [Candidatus Bathyarchaeia archaeon]
MRLCPRCKSSQLQLSSWLDAWLLPEVNICKSCGYRGPLLLELTLSEGEDEEEEEEEGGEEA